MTYRLGQARCTPVLEAVDAIKKDLQALVVGRSGLYIVLLYIKHERYTEGMFDDD